MIKQFFIEGVNGISVLKEYTGLWWSMELRKYVSNENDIILISLQLINSATLEVTLKLFIVFIYSVH